MKYEVKIVWNGGDTSLTQLVEGKTAKEAIDQISFAIFEEINEYIILVKEYNPLWEC